MLILMNPYYMVFISPTNGDFMSPYCMVFICPSCVDFNESLLYGFYLSFLCWF